MAPISCSRSRRSRSSRRSGLWRDMRQRRRHRGRAHLRRLVAARRWAVRVRRRSRAEARPGRVPHRLPGLDPHRLDFGRRPLGCGAPECPLPGDEGDAGDHAHDLSRLGTPVFVRTLQLAGNGRIWPDYYVVPILDANGAATDAAELELNPAHTAIHVVAIATYAQPHAAGVIARPLERGGRDGRPRRAGPCVLARQRGGRTIVLPRRRPGATGRSLALGGRRHLSRRPQQAAAERCRARSSPGQGRATSTRPTSYRCCAEVASTQLTMRGTASRRPGWPPRREGQTDQRGQETGQ